MSIGQRQSYHIRPLNSGAGSSVFNNAGSGLHPAFASLSPMADEGMGGQMGGRSPHPAFSGMSPLPDGGVGGATDNPFQRSLNRERANTAAKAGAFASLSPLPMMAPGGRNGGAAVPDGTPDATYKGAFGSGPAAEQAARAAREAFVGSQMNKANQENLGPATNYFAKMRYADDANSRSNSMVGGQVGLLNAQSGQIGAATRGQDAWTNRIVPMTEDEMRAHTEEVRQATAGRQAKLQPELEGMQAQARAANARAIGQETQNNFIAPAEQASLEAQKASLERFKGMTPLLESQYLNANPDIAVAGQPRGSTGKAATPPPPVSANPASDFDLYQKRMKLAKEEGTRRYYQQTGIYGTPFFRSAFVADANHPDRPNKSIEALTQEEFDKQMKSAGATRPEVPAGPTLVEGQRGVHGPTGRNVVVRNGTWTFADAAPSSPSRPTAP